MPNRLPNILAVFLALIFLLTTAIPASAAFEGILGKSASVLILYDEPEKGWKKEDPVEALMLRQLLGHFKYSTIKMMSSGQYLLGKEKEFDILFYIGTKPYLKLPGYLLDDIYSRNKRTIWINANLNRLSERHNLDRYGFVLKGHNNDNSTNMVTYKGQELWKPDPGTYHISIQNPTKCKVIAWATWDKEYRGPKPRFSYPEKEYGYSMKTKGEDSPGDSNFTIPVTQGKAAKLPWVVRSDNFWYFASNPFAFQIEGGAYLVLCDILHDVFKSRVKTDHPAFVRIEDVHAKRDAEKLVAVADYLSSRNIPFGFTITPVYVNPQTGERIALSTNPQFRDTIRRLVVRGGIPILHGYTHQRIGETAVDYEFWNKELDRPASRTSAYASERVLKALSECFHAEVYPIAWTTPHYAAGQVDYRAFRSYFTTVMERRQPVDKLGSDQFFPYTIYRDMHSQIIIPENLGYVQPAVGRTPKAIIRDAKNGLVVRDGWASFFFHSFLDLQLLDEIVTGIESLGYRWVSLAQFNNKARTPDAVVASGSIAVDLKLEKQYLYEFVLGQKGRKKEESYSLNPVTGEMQKFLTIHPGERMILKGVFTIPAITWQNALKFTPITLSVANPIATFLIFVGMFVLTIFFIVWVMFMSRKAVRRTVIFFRNRKVS